MYVRQNDDGASVALRWAHCYGSSTYWTYPLFPCYSITHKYTLFYSLSISCHPSSPLAMFTAPENPQAFCGMQHTQPAMSLGFFPLTTASAVSSAEQLGLKTVFTHRLWDSRAASCTSSMSSCLCIIAYLFTYLFIYMHSYLHVTCVYHIIVSLVFYIASSFYFTFL